MSDRYYLKEKKTGTGPFTNEQLEAFYLGGLIDGDTPCQPDKITTWRWKPLRDFFPHFRSLSGAKEQKGSGYENRKDGPGKPGDQERSEIRTAAFDCVECDSRLRLRLEQCNAFYRCPSCGTEYKSIQGEGEPPVLLVMLASRPRKSTAIILHYWLMVVNGFPVSAPGMAQSLPPPRGGVSVIGRNAGFEFALCFLFVV